MLRRNANIVKACPGGLCFFFFFKYILCALLPVCLCVRGHPGPLELEFQAIISWHVGAGS